MNDGINSRMGVFTIRLRGFDNEEDIKKLVEARLKKVDCIKKKSRSVLERSEREKSAPVDE